MNASALKNGLPSRIAVVASSDGSEHVVSLRSADNVSTALRQCFQAVKIFPFDAGLEQALLAWRPDVVFPVAHGSGETGELQSMLDSIQMLYVGSDSASSALCWDKAVTNQKVVDLLTSQSESLIDVMRAVVPPFMALQKGDAIKGKVQEFCRSFARNGVLVIKPAREGSSVGIAFCTAPGHKLLTKEEVIATINGSVEDLRLDRIVQSVERAFTFDSIVILQKAIHGTEITVGVLENPETRALPVVEIVTPVGAWYDYAHKYSQGGSENLIPARLPQEWLGFAQDTALAVHRHLGCRDYSRVDFIVECIAGTTEPKQLWFLEINSLPGFTATSLFPDAARAASLDMPELVRRLVSQAWSRRGVNTTYLDSKLST